MIDLRAEAERLYSEYERLAEESELFPAFARLGRLAFMLSDSNLKESAAIEARLRAVSLSAEDHNRLKSSAQDQIDKLRRMLSVGTEYVFEEMIWLITLRVDLWLVEKFLTDYLRSGLDASVTAIDREISEMKRDPNFAKLLHSADRHVKKHALIGLIDIEQAA